MCSQLLVVLQVCKVLSEVMWKKKPVLCYGGQHNILVLCFLTIEGYPQVTVIERH